MRSDRLAEIARIAVSIEADTGFPPAALVAQWAIESHWGERPIGRYGVFGMKAATRHSLSTTAATHEWISGELTPVDQRFADYDSLESAARDYAHTIMTAACYQPAWREYQRDGKIQQLLNGIAEKYAPGNRNYGHLANVIACQENVFHAICDAYYVENK